MASKILVSAWNLAFHILVAARNLAYPVLFHGAGKGKLSPFFQWKLFTYLPFEKDIMVEWNIQKMN